MLSIMEVSAMDILAYASIPAAVLVALPLIYTYTSSTIRARFPTLRNKKICLLIAHPDDEAMFFAPTVLALTRPETGNHVKILCLSTGNSDGLGETRRRELVKSAMLLGLRREEDVFVIDNPRDFPDSITTTWDSDRISTLLCNAFAPHIINPAKSSRRNSSATVAIDALITFDDGGVSSHPNHISLYHGARSFITKLLKGKPGTPSSVDLYTLTSVGMFRKYAGCLDAFATMMAVLFRGKRARQQSEKGNPGTLLNMSSLFGGHGQCYGLARRAMTDAHKSQMVWFRWGWIGHLSNVATSPGPERFNRSPSKRVSARLSYRPSSSRQFGTMMFYAVQGVQKGA